MIAGALAYLAAAATPAPLPLDDPDLRCVAAVAAMLGSVTQSEQTDAEMLTGLTAVFMYYLGKVDARSPGLDYAQRLTALMNAQGYDLLLAADLKRCGGEAETRGATLKELGEQMKAAAPLAPAARPG